VGCGCYLGILTVLYDIRERGGGGRIWGRIRKRDGRGDSRLRTEGKEKKSPRWPVGHLPRNEKSDDERGAGRRDSSIRKPGSFARGITGAWGVYSVNEGAESKCNIPENPSG
jgi:hypothetical protein